MTEITGRHVLAVTTGAFGLIIAVNLLLAYKAVSTFPGLEVPNSYVASQGFDDRRAAQVELGWTLTSSYEPTSGRLSLDLADINGQAAPVTALKVLVGRATEARDDQWPEMTMVDGTWKSKVDLSPGKWILKVEALSVDGVLFEQRVNLLVEG